MAEEHEQELIETAITIHDNDCTDQLINLMTKLKINEKPEFYSHAYQRGERWEYDMTVKINPPRGERDMYYFRTRHRRDTVRAALYDVSREAFLRLNHIYQDRLQHSRYSYHPMREPGEDYCTLQNVDYHEQPVKATMSIWMEAADDMYEEALEHMDVQRKRLEEAERRENVLKHKYRILHELYEEREKQNSILNICVAGAAFCLHQIPNMGSDDDDDDGMEGHISPVHEGEPLEPNPPDNGEEVLQGLPPSPPPLYPIHSDDEAEEMHSAMDISEPSQEPEILRPNRVFHINDLNTAPYKGGAAEGGRRPSIWNIFEQRSTPTPCASFTTCSGPGFLPVVF
ncbi:hypothetical protein OsI_20407 [Oryza sativa Indica Group]|uniref:Uncharacterized protein n=1 Tax=Oryza sativa subsp. indica TaxID=39946 RepID=B8AZG9_ORYSI|nr:hypothetical protein OsI_20407 [Oryza sativa Indica Group]